MLSLTVLSPHRDDAVFSLGLGLSRWSKAGLPITIVNFFTVSSYAPHSLETSIAGISVLRKQEDIRALANINPSIRLRSLGLWDAPLRLNISAASINLPGNRSLLTQAEIEHLSRRMQSYLAGRIVLAPLALGNHIDHWLVHSAALLAQGGRRLGFYEDLPYATWTSNQQLAERVAETEETSQVPLRPAIIRNPQALQHKFRAAIKYRSQITRQEAQNMTAYASRYGMAERIWIPRHERRWHALLDARAILS